MTQIDPQGDRTTVASRLQDGTAVVGVVTGHNPIQALMDRTQLFSVQAAQAAFARMAQTNGSGGKTTPPVVVPEVLYNPDLKTSWIMIPGLTGLILLFIGTLITSLGIVRERQAGTIEQLAVTPFRPWDVIFGKMLPTSCWHRSTSPSSLRWA